LNLIRLHAPWEPTFPAHYYNVRTQTTPTKAVPAVQAPSATNIAAGTIELATSGRTHPPTGPTATPATIRTRGSVQRKPTPINPSFQRFVDMNLRVRDVMVRAGAANRVPTNSNGIEMCLSYHIKGMCNTNCARNGDHKEHTAAEDQAILRWCEAHYKPSE
jgi:hypothetical protein